MCHKQPLLNLYTAKQPIQEQPQSKQLIIKTENTIHRNCAAPHKCKPQQGCRRSKQMCFIPSPPHANMDLSTATRNAGLADSQAARQQEIHAKKLWSIAHLKP
eukprot:scaffold592_cov21-Tisochrysis_lutea.AAC.1